MAHVTFVHTAAVHEQTFEALTAAAGISCAHKTEPQWLVRAQQDGLTAQLRSEVAGALHAAAEHSDAVVCTCSSLGPIAEQLQRDAAQSSADPSSPVPPITPITPIIRVDAPMMAEAVTRPPVLLAYCLASTRQSSATLLANAFNDAGCEAQFSEVHCSEAWQHFERSEPDAYAAAIVSAILQATSLPSSRAAPPQTVVLAQASMAVAAPALEKAGFHVLSAATSCVAHLIRLFKTTAGNP